MSRLRSSMILLGICVLALLVGALRLLTEQPTLPTGSSYSAQPSGALALYDWATAIGGTARRLRDPDLRQPSGQASTTLLVLQPESPVTDSVRTTFDLVPEQGGTLVVAGDSVSWLLYARGLGITVEPIRDAGGTAATPDGALRVPSAFRYRVRADGATPLLVLPNGDWVALRAPYRQGSLVVLATPTPLTNAGLSADETSRLVYRDVLAGAAGGGALVFDEINHSFAPVEPGPPTANQLLFTSAPGRALIYTAGLVFLYLLFSGRRLGPPIPARSPVETRRTMYEHVQVLASLYRRAGQFAVVRAAFGRQMTRELARGGRASTQRAAILTDALARVESARTESELIAAVAAAQRET
ncbi:MAG TPA: DUF4350 domain-containing protein [Chloroflexota bacterium]|nr:DUF4350 domain-containing protein [Chloroflexota bacterium]